MRWNKGNFSRPHSHPNDPLHHGPQGHLVGRYRTKFDPENSTVAMPEGTFVIHFGKQVHRDGAKAEDTMLLMVGEGSATSTPAAK
jgi:hypothetical protein